MSQIARLQRWLDRLTATYENKKWASAIAEADCMSAELRAFREDLSAKLSETSDNEIVCWHKSFTPYIKVVGTAMLLVCLCAFPVSVESSRPHDIAALPTGVENKEFLLVSSEERELLQMLRANLRDNNPGFVMAEEKPAITAKQARVPTRTTARTPQKAQEISERPKAYAINPQDMLTLIQIGERRLRGDSPVIRIVN